MAELWLQFVRHLDLIMTKMKWFFESASQGKTDLWKIALAESTELIKGEQDSV